MDCERLDVYLEMIWFRCQGTNLQALIDHTKSRPNETSSVIALVISNVADVAGLKRAEKAGIQTKVIITVILQI